jgi:hypothetical protein
MLGGTTKGFCLREWEMWYGDKPAADQPGQMPCPLPLTDGKLCGDADLDGKRCPYSRSNLKVDMTKCELTTYAKKHNGVLATGGAGLAAHDPQEIEP